MNLTRIRTIRTIANERGQSMVEYVVIVAAIIAALYTSDDVMKALNDAIKGSQEGYSYTISVAELPDEKKP